MKKLRKRMISLALAAALSCGLFAAVPVSAASAPTYDETVTSYLGAKSSKYGYMHSYAEIEITNCAQKPTNVKLSSEDLGLTSVEFDKSSKTACITVNSSKAGIYKVTFKVRDTKYKCNVVFRKHTCPIHTLKITGVRNGKNIASYTQYANQNSSKLKLKENVSDATIALNIKSGWKLSQIGLYRYKKNGTIDRTMFNKENILKTGTCSHRLGNLKTNREYVLTMTFENLKNGGTVYLTYYMNE